MMIGMRQKTRVRGFKGYRKLMMVGVRFEHGHCSLGGQEVLFRQERLLEVCVWKPPGVSVQGLTKKLNTVSVLYCRGRSGYRRL